MKSLLCANMQKDEKVLNNSAADCTEFGVERREEVEAVA